MLCECEAGLSTVNVSVFDSHTKPSRRSLLPPTPLLQPLRMSKSFVAKDQRWPAGHSLLYPNVRYARVCGDLEFLLQPDLFEEGYVHVLLLVL